ncbi:MAG TPA: hypothetical protein VJU80_10925 [Solirubrobacteraceae bacterium]|nr:hypothetical protein [Solirubrobacteraceae bacterium]
MRTRYLTDGVHLYEIADQRTVQNFGLRRGTISYTVIREVVSEAVARIDDLHLAALSEVHIDGPGVV